MTSTYNTATDPVESTAVSTSISQAPTTKAEALESWKSEVNAAWDTHFPALNAARERAEKCELESADNVCKYLTKFTENLSNLTKRGTMPLKNESSRLPNLMSLAISAQHNLKALERELGRESDFDETIRWDIKEAAWKAQESMFPLFAKRYGIQRGLIPSEKFKNDNATLWWKQQCDGQSSSWCLVLFLIINGASQLLGFPLRSMDVIVEVNPDPDQSHAVPRGTTL